MTTYGVTPLGYVRKPFDVMLDEVEAEARVAFGAPDLDIRTPEGALASIYLPLIERLAKVDEVNEITYNAIDPNRATGQSYEAVGALRGVERKPATVGTHEGVSVTADSAIAGTVLRGAIRFNPEGQPDNVWINSNDLTIPGGGIYSVAAESELSGSQAVFEQGATVTIIAGPSEISLIEIPSDAEPGTDLEEESAWRARSEDIIEGEQTDVGAALEDLDTVTSARVVETAGYIQCIINDILGPEPNDNIAQVIFDSKCKGVVTLGDETGTSINNKGEPEIMRFDRTAIVNAYAVVVVLAPEGASEGSIKEAVQSVQAKLSGKTVYWSQMNAAVSGVGGVIDVSSLTIGRSVTPTGTENLTANIDEQIVFPNGNIDVTINS